MLTFIDFQKRSQEGPLTTASDFDLMLSKKAREIVKRYNLRKLDMQNIMVDDETADAVFNAAVDFLSEVGVFNTDTQRIIQWSKEEVLELAADYKNNPRIFTLGANADAVTVKPRTSTSKEPPVLLPAGGPVFKQEHLEPMLKTYCKESCVQGFTKAGGLPMVDGIPATKGMPGETYCTLKEVDEQTRILTEAGRPDIFRGNVATATTLAPVLASMGEGRYVPSNFMFGIHIMPEQKLDWDRLNTAYTLQRLNVMPWSSAMSMVGGLAGGPGGAAMCCVANLLAQLSYGRGPWCSVGLNNMQGSSKTRDALKAYSLALRAVERNVGVTTGVPCVDSAKASCYEEAIVAGVAIAVVCTASGMGIDWFAGSSPLTARIHAEVNKNIAGMEPEQINVILNNLLAKVDEIAAAKGPDAVVPFPAQLFPAIYNMETLEPQPYYLAAAKNAVEMLKECGVPVTDALVLD